MDFLPAEPGLWSVELCLTRAVCGVGARPTVADVAGPATTEETVVARATQEHVVPRVAAQGVVGAAADDTTTHHAASNDATAAYPYSDDALRGALRPQPAEG